MEEGKEPQQEEKEEFIYAPYTLGFLGYTPPNKVEVSEFRRFMNKKQTDIGMNSTNRHWLTREFPLLKSGGEENKKLVAMELGCGVGNTIFPLLKENPYLFFYGLDFAKTAIELMKAHDEYDESRCKGYVCDITKDEGWPSEIPDESVDVATMIFVLSAISPEKMKCAVSNVYRLLKKGGVVLFRDYAEGDKAQARFESEGMHKKIADNFHVRGDGTRAYYFPTGFAEQLWKEGGFIIEKQEIVERDIMNQRMELQMNRLFLQAVYCKAEQLT